MPCERERELAKDFTKQNGAHVMRWAAIRAFLGIMGLAVKGRCKGAGLLPRPLKRAMEPAMGTVDAMLSFKRVSTLRSQCTCLWYCV